MRLLLVEDEHSLSKAIATILKKNNYSVDAVYNGEDALIYLQSQNYDGVILDIMIPKINGIEVLKNMRTKGDKTPVLILSAKSQIEDKIIGLDSGSNDYLTKPFDINELLARIRAMTREMTNQSNSKITIGNTILDCATYEIIGPLDRIKLANKEFQMIQMLMNHPKHLVSTNYFMERIWGYDSDSEINVVWVYISYLRKKLAEIGSNIKIKTRRSSGYYLEV